MKVPYSSESPFLHRWGKVGLKLRPGVTAEDEVLLEPINNILVRGILKDI